MILISKTPVEHSEHLQKVFNQLRKHELKVKLSKCQFVKDETKYLGFVINKTEIKPDLHKVEVLEPKTVRKVCGFLGASEYYRHFVLAFNRLAVLDSLDEKVH